MERRMRRWRISYGGDGFAAARKRGDCSFGAGLGGGAVQGHYLWGRWRGAHVESSGIGAVVDSAAAMESDAVTGGRRKEGRG